MFRIVNTRATERIDSKVKWIASGEKTCCEPIVHSSSSSASSEFETIKHDITIH